MLRELRPDVVPAHWLPGFAFFAAVARARPLVAMAWGSDVLRARRSPALPNRVGARRAALVMADSQAPLDRVVAQGAARDRSSTFERFRPADVDARRALRAELGVGDGPIILCLARWCRSTTRA